MLASRLGRASLQTFSAHRFAHPSARLLLGGKQQQKRRPQQTTRLPPQAQLHRGAVAMASGKIAPAGAQCLEQVAAPRVEPRMAELKAKQAEWAALPISEKADLVQKVREHVMEVAEEWSRASIALKGIDSNEGAGELVKVVAIVAAFLGRLLSGLRYAARHGRLPENPLRTLASGQQVAKVYPVSLADRLDTMGVYGFEAEVWIQPGKPASQGKDLLAGSSGGGGLAVVLAAGNHSYIGFMDALDQLFIHNRVVLLKYHEVQAPLTPFLEHILKPLRDRGYIWGAHAGIEVTQQMIFHPAVTHVHMTGGNATHEAIVWGPPGESREERKRARDPLLKVPMSSELGNISPWIVTPDPGWTPAELEHHAMALTEAVLDNSSCNCLAAKVVLLSDSWQHGDEFVRRLKDGLRAAAPVAAWYPGIKQRSAEFLKHYPEAEIIRSDRGGSDSSSASTLPVAVLELNGLPQTPESEHCLTVEPFSPVVTILRVPSNGAEDFLGRAVEFCNEKIQGTLTCTLLVHPNTARGHKEAVDSAIENLRYGLVAVNGWSGLGFALEVAHWGGFQRPEHEEGSEGYVDALADPVSGLGSVHNAYMYDYAEKSVLRTPFVSGLHPKPRHLAPLPMMLPYTPSKPWLWRMARIFSGFLLGGPSGIKKMVF